MDNSIARRRARLAALLALGLLALGFLPRLAGSLSGRSESWVNVLAAYLLNAILFGGLAYGVVWWLASRRR